jgi:hypothetical protein
MSQSFSGFQWFSVVTVVLAGPVVAIAVKAAENQSRISLWNTQKLT